MMINALEENETKKKLGSAGMSAERVYNMKQEDQGNLIRGGCLSKDLKEMKCMNELLKSRIFN